MKAISVELSMIPLDTSVDLLRGNNIRAARYSRYLRLTTFANCEVLLLVKYPHVEFALLWSH